MRNQSAHTGRGSPGLTVLRWLAGVCVALSATAQTDYDFGDANAGEYPVLLSQDGARHVAPTFVYLGEGVDIEAEALTSPAADGDDLDGDDDEDGIALLGLLAPGRTARLQVVASTDGYLQGWIDFLHAGWTLPSAVVLQNQPVAAGVSVVTFLVPAEAPPGIVTARFRFSTITDLGITGTAPNGEVEDYQFEVVSADFGDAPEGGPNAQYPTTLAEDGAYHELSGIYLGVGVDADADGQPNALADGDDTDSAGDDEDGVTWLDPVELGRNVDLAVEVSQDGWLQAWLDLDRDGTWNGSVEQVFVSEFVLAGTNLLSISIPSDAQPGPSYARFRLSTLEVLGAFGFARDGEVEDYRVQLLAYDFGDAFGSEPYPTPRDLDGARHVIQPDIHLGEAIDGEPDASTTVDSTGDDAVGLDDDDGIIFDEPMFPGMPWDLRVVASTNGYLQGWIDFDDDGVWAEGSERVLLNEALLPGTNALSVPVSPEAQFGHAYVRFRFSTQLDVGVSGEAPDGEVEDYLVPVQSPVFDFGDAPSAPSYPTLLQDNGARHSVNTNVVLGAGITSESDGQPDSLAEADADDGVQFLPPWRVGATCVVDVVASTAGYLQVWFDINVNGSWGDAGEQVAVDLPVTNGHTALAVFVPPGAGSQLYARFRFSTQAGTGFTGAAPDGEVEDYRVVLTAIDCGDAPDTGASGYPVWVAAGGAYHQVPSGIFLGAAPDAEPDGEPDAQADRDTDDGVRWLSALRPGATVALEVDTSAPGYLQVWLDFSRDGDWSDASEQIFANQTATEGGTHLLTFVVPGGAAIGSTYARFRVATSSGIDAGGGAADGEVEDYRVIIESAIVSNVPSGPCSVWLQRPNRDYGIDVQSWILPSLGVTNGRVVRAADDWISDGRRLTGCRWWGSYINWASNPAAVPAASRPHSFRITLYADGISTNDGFTPQPGIELTNTTVSLLPYGSPSTQTGQATERYLATSALPFSSPGDFEYEYAYDATFSNAWPLVNGLRYWFSVESIHNAVPTYRWGWCVAFPREGLEEGAYLRKSSDKNWIAMTYPPNVFPWTTTTNHPDVGQPVEMAFEPLTDDCPRRAHQWPTFVDMVTPAVERSWQRLGDAPSAGVLRMDDVVADGRRVASITWEGAYAGWMNTVAGSPTNRVAPPTGVNRPQGFILTCRLGDGCAPGALMTNVFVSIAQCNEQFVTSWPQPWPGPGTNYLQAYQYEVDLLDAFTFAEPWFLTAGSNYWLGVQAVFSAAFAPGPAGHTGWGWRTASDQVECISVVSSNGMGNWIPAGRSDAPVGQLGQPFDLVFDMFSDAPGFSPLYSQPEILRFDRLTNGTIRLESVGDLGSGVQVLQSSTNLLRNLWFDVETNNLPRDWPYTNRWLDAQPPGKNVMLRIQQR